MNGNFIATTPKHHMHALAYQGIMVTECHAQLRDMLRTRLGDEYVLLFAEPAFNTADNTVDWYTPVQGEVRRLIDLPPEEQNTLRDRLIHMANELRLLAEELRRSPENAKITRGNILQLALCYPDISCLYVIGGQPVFTCWGYGPGTPGAEPQDLCRLTRVAVHTQQAPEAAPKPKPIPAPAAPARRFGWGWLWWLLPLLLLLLLLGLLFTSFGTWPALSGTALYHAPALPFWQTDTAELNSRQQANAALEQDIADLRTRLNEHAALCLPEKNAPAQPPKPEQPQKKDELIIPEKPDTIAFMMGRWRCETGLINSTTQEPIIVEFQFNRRGEGQGIVYEKNNLCRGKAKARLTPKGLHVTLSEQQCGNGKTYTQQAIDCHNSSGSAQCFGKNQGGEPWKAQFFRIAE